MSRKILILVVFMLCIFGGGCAAKSNRDCNEGEKTTADVEKGVRVSWLANIMSSNDISSDNDKLFPVENIDYTGEDMKLYASISVNQENKADITIPIMCILIIDGKLVPFSVEGGNISEVNYINITNGIEKVIGISFYPYGLTEEYKDIVLVGISYYDQMQTEEPSDNVIIYCKKNIKSVVGNTDILEKNTDDTVYFSSEDTKSVYGKELYEISKYNGKIKDFIVQKNESAINYLGNYNKVSGMTLLFIDGKLYKGFNGYYALNWWSDKLYINAEIDISELEKGNHSICAVTLAENDVILARKSFNTEITIE